MADDKGQPGSQLKGLGDFNKKLLGDGMNSDDEADLSQHAQRNNLDYSDTIRETP
jgi:hypothetical protein